MAGWHVTDAASVWHLRDGNVSVSTLLDDDVALLLGPNFWCDAQVTMNNAWATIARRACRTTALAQRTPATSLINERNLFADPSRAVETARWSIRSAILSKTIGRSFSVGRISEARSSTSRGVAKHLSKDSRKPAKPATTRSERQHPSKLRVGTTLASHTEGAVPAEKPGMLTWRDYDPEGGMPLPTGDLTQAEVDATFGQDTDVDTGIYVINVMNWRRKSGALIDVGLDFPAGMGVTRQMAINGLEYVRSLDPGFDEQAAGENWAFEESERLREKLRQRSVSLGLYKSEEPEYEEEEDLAQGTQQGRERSGESILQKQRQEKEAAWGKEQAMRKARQEQEEQARLHSTRGPLELSAGVQPSVALVESGATGVAISGARTKAWLQPIERKPWVKYYEEQAQIIKTNLVPHLNILQRLGPGLLLTLVVLGGCVYLSENYTPPPTSARMFPDTPPAVATVACLTGILLTVFLASRMPWMWRANSKYFTVVPAYPYAASLVGAIFRHDTVRHIVPNIAVLWAFGVALHEDVGRGTFLAIFLGSGVIGGYSGLVYYVLTKHWMAYVFGSSSSMLGVLAACCYLRPDGSISLFGYTLPFGAWILASLWGASTLYSAVRKRATDVDHIGHLGGLLSGLAAAAHLKRRAQRKSNLMHQTPAVASVAGN